MKSIKIYRWDDKFYDICRLVEKKSVRQFEVHADGEIEEIILGKDESDAFRLNQTGWVLVTDVAKSESSIIQPAPKIKVTRARSLCYFKSNNGKSTQEYNQYNEPTANTYECPIVISYAS